MLTIESLLQQLMLRAQQLDDDHRRRGKLMAEQWFAEHIFKCRSNLAVDYVAETRQLWQQRQSSKQSAAIDYLEQQISQQLRALHTALGQAPLPRAGTDRRLIQQSTLTAMHKQLTQYRDYEQRLQAMVEQYRQQQNTLAAQQQEKRLNRCQQAIQQLEHKIQRAEEG